MARRRSCGLTTLADGTWRIGQGEHSVVASASAFGAQQVTFNLDGRVHRLFFALAGEPGLSRLDGVEHVLTDTTDAAAVRDKGGAASGRISAPMNGQVVALQVQQGDAVAAGQVLLVIEAMKMEHSIVAPLDGQVAQPAGAAGRAGRAGPGAGRDRAGRVIRGRNPPEPDTPGYCP